MLFCECLLSNANLNQLAHLITTFLTLEDSVLMFINII